MLFCNVFLTHQNHCVGVFHVNLSAAANTKDLDVYIKRNTESGFGFRVLGGEGPDQPVGDASPVET